MALKSRPLDPSVRDSDLREISDFPRYRRCRVHNLALHSGTALWCRECVLALSPVKLGVGEPADLCRVFWNAAFCLDQFDSLARCQWAPLWVGPCYGATH